MCSPPGGQQTTKQNRCTLTLMWDTVLFTEYQQEQQQQQHLYKCHD